MSWIDRLHAGLAKTRVALGRSLDLITGRALDPAAQEELEAALLASDIGVRTVSKLMARLLEQGRTAADARAVMHAAILDALQGGQREPIEQQIKKSSKPFVILAVGVNGVGKTTTVAKLAQRLKQDGLTPLLVAADTFRAAAIEQLELWGNRTGVDVIRHKQGADPSAVVFDGLAAAKARGVDVVLIDTAGRLHTKTNLMEELKKVKRVLARELLGAPHEVLLVLDGTVGQNALAQAKQFHEAVGVTGIALTKLDGTARGGVVVAIAEELKIPVRLIGVGESADDLQDFDARSFVDALFGKD
ncbi:MAG: signal recognition particle-docking protein FtsY [Nitrospiraceae bacterium]|nr:signal recognition particle-docking protein FtsY [Nitrospiraceae bacterium]